MDIIANPFKTLFFCLYHDIRMIKPFGGKILIHSIDFHAKLSLKTQYININAKIFYHEKNNIFYDHFNCCHVFLEL